MLNGSVANEQRRKRSPCKQMILVAGAWEKLWTLSPAIFLASKQAEITIGASFPVDDSSALDAPGSKPAALRALSERWYPICKRSRQQLEVEGGFWPDLAVNDHFWPALAVAAE